MGSISLGAIEPRPFSDEEVDLIGNVTDQVAGTLARARLIQTQQRLVTAIEQTAESVLITDTEGTILYVNPAYERITGYSRTEAIGRKPSLVKSGKQGATFYQDLWTTISSGQVWQGRFANKKKDGTLYTDEATITPVLDKNGSIINYVGIQRDVTRELQLEEQYRHAQKMEAVGHLTAGIAHDFNNLLTAINGFAELIRRQLKPDDSLQEFVDTILTSGRRAVDLVQQLLVFSHKQVTELQVLDLNTNVANIDKMLRRIIGENIELKTNLTPDLWWVRVDSVQMEQIIVNLAVNARDAMPDGGRLTIETANVALDDDYVAHHLDAQPGEHVLLAVSDTGCGMSDEVKSHIFDPFFTTKEMGKGTGLGLSTVFGIVKQSKGHIWVYSEEGIGTTFKIYLPRTEEHTPSSVRSEIETAMPLGTETILLVEDDAYVRELARRVLQRQGYTVLEAEDSQEALRLFLTHTAPIHLLLTDVVMPGISGKALAEQLTQTKPNLKVLFMSGYTDDAIMRHGVLDPGIAFLQKPFNPTALIRKVRTVLDGL